MKKIITIASLFIVMTTQAQTKVTKDANGNYIAVTKSDTSANKATGATFTDRDGKKYLVIISARWKLFITAYQRTAILINVILKLNKKTL